MFESWKEESRVLNEFESWNGEKRVRPGRAESLEPFHAFPAAAQEYCPLCKKGSVEGGDESKTNLRWSARQAYAGGEQEVSKRTRKWFDRGEETVCRVYLVKSSSRA